MFRIAVVEDDFSVRRGLGRLLRSAGFDVGLYESAESFLKECMDPLPNALIVDIQLGGMTGLDLINELRGRNLEIPTIIITAAEDMEGLELPQNAHSTATIPLLHKPFDAQTLLDSVEYVLTPSL